METFITQRKKQYGFTLVEFIIILAVFNCITLIAVPVYQNSMKQRAWTKTIAATTPLKQAITRCLRDSKGDASICNDFSANKLARYGIDQAPANEAFVAVVRNNAAIKIAGTRDLGLCSAIFTPTISVPIGVTKWNCVMEKAERNGDSLQKCRQYIEKCAT